MDRDSIKNKLENVFIDVFDDDSIELFDEMTAADIEEWDSLTHVQLILAVEQAFNLKFKTAEIIDLQNVGEMLNLLSSKLAI